MFIQLRDGRFINVPAIRLATPVVRHGLMIGMHVVFDDFLKLDLTSVDAARVAKAMRYSATELAGRLGTWTDKEELSAEEREQIADALEV